MRYKYNLLLTGLLLRSCVRSRLLRQGSCGSDFLLSDVIDLCLRTLRSDSFGGTSRSIEDGLACSIRGHTRHPLRSSLRDGLCGLGRRMRLHAGSILLRCTPGGSNAGNAFGGTFESFEGGGLTASLGYCVRMNPLCRRGLGRRMGLHSGGTFSRCAPWGSDRGNSFGVTFKSFEGGGLTVSLGYCVHMSPVCVAPLVR